MCFNNLVVRSPSENWQSRTEWSTYKGTLGAYTYTRDQLITMSTKLKNNKYCILPFDTIKNIRELRLNKCQTRKHNNKYLFKPKK